MEQVLPERNIKVIKSMKAPNQLTHTEELFGEYNDDDQVIQILRKLEDEYSKNPLYEKLHGFKERMSLSFRHLESQETVSFMTEG